MIYIPEDICRIVTRIVPRPTVEGVVLPYPTIILYATYLVAGGLVLVTGLVKMDYTAIPSDCLVPTVLAIVLASLFLFAVLYLVGYQEKKSKVLELRATAIKNGQAVDEIAMAKVQSFNNIYVMALLIGTAITSAVTYLAMISVIPENVAVVTTIDYVLWAIAGVIAIGLVFDKVMIHPIADGTFKKKVLDPLTDEIISKFQEDSKDAPALTNDQLNTLIQALTGAMKKE